MSTFRLSMSCKNSARSQRGFGVLIEIIVGVGLLALLAAVGMEWMRVRAQNSARDTAVSEYVTDAKILVRAATEYVTEQEASWAAGSVHTITIATLEAAGKLPAGFGARAYGAGRTPYGAPFRIVSIRNTGEPGSKTVIGDAPSDSQVAFEALGYPYNAIQALAVKRSIAAALVAEGYPVATTTAGSATAMGGGSNQWTKPLSAWIGTPNWPGLHVLMGWPDLAGSLPDGNGEDAAFNGTCEIAVARNPTCGVGYTEYDRWDACRSSGYTVRQTPNGLTMAYGMESVEAPNTVPCNTTCSESYGVACQHKVSATTRNEIYQVEGLRIAEIWCNTSYPRNDTPTYPASCVINESYAYPNYAQPITGVVPKAILCCKSN